MVLTWRQTPRFCGLASRSLTLLIFASERRGFLMSWLIVGISYLVPLPALSVETGARSSRGKSGSIGSGWGACKRYEASLGECSTWNIFPLLLLQRRQLGL